MSAETATPVPASRLATVFVEGAGLFVAIPLWVWWAVWKGGHPAAVFLPGIVYIAAAAAVLQAFAVRPRLRGPAAWALGALAAFTLWSLASLLWADDKGAAEVAAARQILFFGAFALPLLWPPSRRALLVGLATLPAVALAGGISALAAALGDPALLADGRLVDPTGYANASAALMAIGILPAVILASRPELAIGWRVAALTVAGLLGGMLVLAQSRGGVAGLALALLLAFALVPGRLRLAIPVAIAALAVGATLDPLLGVRSAIVDGGDAAAALDSAVGALGAMGAGLALAATAYAILDTRIEVGTQVVRRASLGAGAVLAAATLAAAAALALSGPDVGGWISDRAEDFRTPDYSRLESERTRFTGGLGSNRYDYWRVSAEIFAEQPLTGTGAGNFIAPFLKLRRAKKSTFYSHSIWMSSLAQLGAVGFLTILGWIVILVLALRGTALRLGKQRRWLVVAAALPLFYVLAHASADWIDAFPVVAAPPLALAGAAAGMAGAGSSPAAGGWRSASLAIALALIAAAILALPLLVSARLADRGATTWAERPLGAIDDLERAAELDPLAAPPYVRLGVIAIELGRPALERRAFRAALERDPSAWYPDFQLGLLAAARGDRQAARAHLALAAARNPREPELQLALRALRAGRAPDPRAAQGRILERSGN
jgi:O-antigen ligase